MWRRLNREEFADTNPLSALDKKSADTFVWRVFEKYEAKNPPPDGGRWPYLVAPEGTEPKRTYEPLRDTPHLFLDFARLHEKGSGAFDQWFAEHGLLGLHPREPWRFRNIGSWTPSDKFEDMGGPTETMYFHYHEARAANYALRLYEAALSRDDGKLAETIFDDEHHGRVEKEILFNMRANITGAERVDVLVDVALQELAMQVNEVLRAYSYPLTTFGLSSEALTPKEPQSLGSLTASLWPRNLLGAMYLQFYWLITSRGELSRCKFCNRFISFARPAIGGKGRKVRNDKQFCSSQCRQNYHYHNRIRSSHQRSGS